MEFHCLDAGTYTCPRLAFSHRIMGAHHPGRCYVFFSAHRFNSWYNIQACAPEHHALFRCLRSDPGDLDVIAVYH